MKHSALKIAIMGLAAIALSGCLGATSTQTTVIRYAYCTDPQGNLVSNPAAANAKGTPLRCYNFIAR